MVEKIIGAFGLLTRVGAFVAFAFWKYRAYYAALAEMAWRVGVNQIKCGKIASRRQRRMAVISYAHEIYNVGNAPNVISSGIGSLGATSAGAVSVNLSVLYVETLKQSSVSRRRDAWAGLEVAIMSWLGGGRRGGGGGHVEW